MSDTLVNRVAKSGLITIRLEEYFPEQPISHFDIKDYLYMEMILREKDFRAALQEVDWSQYQGHTLLIYCSVDAIIPMWAYMLVAVRAADNAIDTYVGDEQAYLSHWYEKQISAIDVETYRDQRLVIKGCSERPVPAHAYQRLTSHLLPVAKSIMYGEPCSTVPLYKRK